MVTITLKCTLPSNNRAFFSAINWISFIQKLFIRFQIYYTQMSLPQKLYWSLLTSAKCHKSGQYMLTKQNQTFKFTARYKSNIDTNLLLCIITKAQSLFNIPIQIKVKKTTNYILNLCDNYRITRIFVIVFNKCTLCYTLFHSFMINFVNRFSTSNGFYCLWT